MVSPLKQKIKQSLIGISGLGLVWLFLAAGIFPVYAAQHAYIRVLVLQDKDSASLEIPGDYEIIDQRQNSVLLKGRDLRTTLVATDNGILLGEINPHLNKFLLKSDSGLFIKINGREFKGDIVIMKDKDSGYLLAINYIELEDYVKGVLYHEVSHLWPMEAIKAQAIVSRTFALYQHGLNSEKDFDVTADIYSQVYGGKTSERYRTNQAVIETEGKILTYRGEIFPTYFSATCAGHTESAENLWKINIEPLKGVVCKYCMDSPHYKWHTDVALDDIRQALSKAGFKITASIDDIIIVARNISGRVERLKIVFGQDQREISGKDFRNAVGPNVIRSANFRVEIHTPEAYFEGMGWGHGVGMCQWGAYFMAKAGHNSEEIINYYYPGAQIVER